MNPLLWKREHQLALLIASATGAAIGLVHGVRSASPIFGFGSHDCGSLMGWLLHDICGSTQHDWFPLIGWPIFGSVLGAAVVYVWHLMQSH
jgi:hypothetical protein